MFARTNAYQIVVSEDNDVIVGFAATEAGNNYISDLWISPDFEGYGIGTALLVNLETAIADRGFDAAEVEVLTENERALSLCRRLGYKIVWPGFCVDEVLLVPLHKTLLRKRV